MPCVGGPPKTCTWSYPPVPPVAVGPVSGRPPGNHVLPSSSEMSNKGWAQRPPQDIQKTRPVCKSAHMFVSLKGLFGVVQSAPAFEVRRTPTGGPGSEGDQAGRNRTVPAFVTTTLTSPVRRPVLFVHGIGASAPLWA